MDQLTRLLIDRIGVVPRLTRLHGGDQSDVFLVTVPDIPNFIVKRGPRVATEARMLKALSDLGTPVPDVLWVAPEVMALRYLPETPPKDMHWRAAGQAVRALHDRSGPSYGWDEDYAFGAVAIPNGPCKDWVTFWKDRRIVPHLSHVDPELARRLEQLCNRLDSVLPKTPVAAVVHGDLWAGNLLFSGRNAWLIDPACHFADCEVDLAMLTLFGTVPDAFWEAYGPRAAGWQNRLPVYQLWPALGHLRLFGAGYRNLVDDLLCRCGV